MSTKMKMPKGCPSICEGEAEGMVYTWKCRNYRGHPGNHYDRVFSREESKFVGWVWE